MKMDKKESGMDAVKALVLKKCCVKQDVYQTTQDVFLELKKVLVEMANELKSFGDENDKRVHVSFSEEEAFECQLRLAGDTLLFHMHTNVFTFPPFHPIHKSPYVAKVPENGYCGVINIYNFLTDSFRYQRLNDSGYLIGRIFVNRERHFFVEGKQQLAYLFNDFASAKLSAAKIQEVMEVTLEYMLNFELFTPPYSAISEVRLSEIQELSQNLKLQTAKRMGFKFQHDDDFSVDF